MQHTSEQQVSIYKRKFDPKPAHTSKERCYKCGDSRHVEQIWIFQSLCHKKKASFKPKAPKAHQLHAEEVHMHDDSICG